MVFSDNIFVKCFFSLPLYKDPKGWGTWHGVEMGLLNSHSRFCLAICNIRLLCCKRGHFDRMECVYIIFDSCKIGLWSLRTLVPFLDQLDMLDG